MSSYTVIQTSSVNIDRYISHDLGIEDGLSNAERELLEKFHTLSEHEDYLFLWTCAQMAADEMTAKNSEIVLTQYGVTEKSYISRTVELLPDDEKQIKTRILRENQQFLGSWALKMQEMEAQRKKINSLTEETRNLLNKNVFAVEAIRRVVKLLIEQGFTPTDPTVVNTSISQALTKGVYIKAENDLKEVREVWLFLPGGKTNVHVTTKNTLQCTRMAREFAIQIGEVFQGIGAVSMPIMSRLGGINLDGSGSDPGSKRGQPLTMPAQRPESSKAKS